MFDMRIIIGINQVLVADGVDFERLHQRNQKPLLLF